MILYPITLQCLFVSALTSVVRPEKESPSRRSLFKIRLVESEKTEDHWTEQKFHVVFLYCSVLNDALGPLLNGLIQRHDTLKSLLLLSKPQQSKAQVWNSFERTSFIFDTLWRPHLHPVPQRCRFCFIFSPFTSANRPLLFWSVHHKSFKSDTAVHFILFTTLLLLFTVVE